MAAAFLGAVLIFALLAILLSIAKAVPPAINLTIVNSGNDHAILDGTSTYTILPSYQDAEEPIGRSSYHQRDLARQIDMFPKRLEPRRRLPSQLELGPVARRRSASANAPYFRSVKDSQSLQRARERITLIV
jgi:hypothetical protein